LNQKLKLEAQISALTLVHIKELVKELAIECDRSFIPSQLFQQRLPRLNLVL